MKNEEKHSYDIGFTVNASDYTAGVLRSSGVLAASMVLDVLIPRRGPGRAPLIAH